MPGFCAGSNSKLTISIPPPTRSHRCSCRRRLDGAMDGASRRSAPTVHERHTAPARIVNAWPPPCTMLVASMRDGSPQRCLIAGLRAG